MYQILIAKKFISNKKNYNYIYSYLFIEANTDSVALPPLSLSLFLSLCPWANPFSYSFIYIHQIFLLSYSEVLTWFNGQHSHILTLVFSGEEGVLVETDGKLSAFKIFLTGVHVKSSDLKCWEQTIVCLLFCSNDN